MSNEEAREVFKALKSTGGLFTLSREGSDVSIDFFRASATGDWRKATLAPREALGGTFSVDNGALTLRIELRKGKPTFGPAHLASIKTILGISAAPTLVEGSNVEDSGGRPPAPPPLPGQPADTLGDLDALDTLDQLGPPPVVLDRGAWSQRVNAYRSAVTSADEQIAALQKVLRSSEDPDLRAIGESGLYGIGRSVRVPFEAALLDAERATSLTDTVVAPAREAATKFVAALSKDKQVEAADQNPFSVKVSLRDLLVPTLEQIARFPNQ